MAASTGVGASGRGGCRRRVGCGKRGEGRGPGGGAGAGPLKRLKLAVEEFVQASCEGRPSGGREGPRAERRARPGGRKSRRELRKEKRQLRKARRLQRTADPGGGAREGSAPRTEGTEGRAPRPPPPAPPPPRAPTRAAVGSTRPSAAAAAARRRALLAANEEEDREIRKLERCLGLHRRRRKGDAGSVPPSFARDGLDYILGALGSAEGRGLCDSSSEEDGPMARHGDAGSEAEDGGDAGSDSEDGGDAGRDSEDGGDAGSESEDGGDAGRDSEDGGDAGSEVEDGGVEQEDAPEEEPQKAAAEGRAKEKAGRRRVRFAEDEETSENSREDVDAAVQVGAHFLEAVVRKFDDIYKKGTEGKECDNLFTIIAHLYNFHVVQSLLIFDILKKLIGTFTEKDIELILLMLRNVGFSLRKDDALSLKELITETQAKASGAGSKFQDQTRIRFMLETMLALKNNDMRKIPGYDPEPVEKLRKLQRALVRGAGSGTESQLRVSWDSVLNAEQTGRWWIVGSAWSGAPMISSQQKAPQKPLAGTVSAKMLELARKQRMNTDVRRNIFCTIMTSEDFLDAFEKLLKLGLKDQQEREIVHVLMDCCLQEKTYNPFYAFLAGKFCNYERRFQMTFQFSIWDKFRDLENLPATNFSNLVYLVAHLLKTKSLPLSILKVIEFSELDKPRVHFLREVLYVLLMGTEAEDICFIFTRVSDNPKLGVLREGLKLFISHFLLKSVQAHRSAEEASALRERAELATKALQGRPSLRM
ncbi:nucleolar MIF4G domain-containing protein 1 isoform X4 [Myotis yumanensis]|uniref:nucleolar MIF4G domain-containing protein 1 isoform X4 n=1 Tax=Myotis yumanensis TaxID=159337 RepID=UPI0038CFA4DE